MLGEMIGEESGQTTGIRVLPSEGPAPTVEVSFQAGGKLLGAETTDMGTYSSVVRPDGTLHGAGQGVIRGELARIHLLPDGLSELGPPQQCGRYL
jgi:hypothetical protein